MRSHKTQGSIIGPGSQVFSLSFLRLTFKTALPTKTSLKGPKRIYTLTPMTYKHTNSRMDLVQMLDHQKHQVLKPSPFNLPIIYIQTA